MTSKLGKIDAEFEVKTPADKFWNSIKDASKLFPKAFPDKYKSIQVLEGDGMSVGSVRLMNYAEGLPLNTFLKVRVESVDDGNKTLGYSVIDGETMKNYKSFNASLAVSPKGDGSLVKWFCEFEKASDETPEPSHIKDFVVKILKDLDAYLIEA